MAGDLELGRDALRHGRWAEGHRRLLRADAHCPLDAADLDRLATCAYLTGAIERAVSSWERAHLAHVAQGDPARAARCGFWLAFVCLNNGERARGAGWVHRGRRLLDQADVDCVERGYLDYCAALARVLDGDAVGAEAGFAVAAEAGDRFGDTELVALSRVGQGRCLISGGAVTHGMALLDEAMALASVTELSPTALGDLYCTAIEGCQEVLDVRRAQEWTEALDVWCRAQPTLVLYRGQCLVHRAELMQLAGSWPEALQEIGRAIARLSSPRSHPALGAAFYIRGDLERLRGNETEAEAAFDQARSWGRAPQPGLALLRLAQGRTSEAERDLRTALAAAEQPAVRARLLAPFVDVALVAGDLPGARAAADELEAIAQAWRTPLVVAASAQALGTVLLAEGSARAALGRLREAWAGWTDLEAAHDAARARALVGLACRAVGDEEGGLLELASARGELERLGASSDQSRRIEHALARRRPQQPDGLTPREVQVLRLLATGVTNRAIATELVISERTVATHVGSILRKLALPSRAAVTRYAHERHLV